MSETGNVRQGLLWQMQSNKFTPMMNPAPILLRNSPQSGTYVHSAALRTALLRWCYFPETLEQIRPCQLEMGQVRMMTGCKSTLPRKARRRAKVNTKTRREIARTTQATNTSNTDINTCKNCGRTGHWAKDCWRPGGGAYDNPTSNNNCTQKGRNHKKGTGKGKQVGVMETNQSSETSSIVSYPSQTSSTIGGLLCNPDVEQKVWIMGVTINLPQGDKLVQSTCFLTVVHWFTRMSNQVSRTKSTVAWSWNPHNKWSSTPTWRKTIGDIQTSRRTDISSVFPCPWGSKTHPVSWLSRSAGVLEWSSRRHWYTVLSWQDPDETQSNTAAQGREFVLLSKGCWWRRIFVFLKMLYLLCFAEPKEGTRSHGAIALTSVMSMWYATCANLRLEREKRNWRLETATPGGIDGISCQHLKVSMTQLLQKHLEWQEDGSKNVWHGSQKRPSMYIAIKDIKTAFDVARPKRIAKFMGDQDVHGWITAAPLREMTEHVSLENVEQVPTHALHPPRERWRSQALSQIHIADSVERGKRMDEEKDRSSYWHMSRWKPYNVQLCVGWQLLGSSTLKDALGTDDEMELIEEAERGGLGTKTRKLVSDGYLSGRGTREHDDQDKQSLHKFPLEFSKSWDSSSIPRWKMQETLKNTQCKQNIMERLENLQEQRCAVEKKCRMLDQTVFCFGSESWFWCRAILDRF